MAKRSSKHRYDEYRFFEVCLGKGPKENPAEDIWVCVKAHPAVMPSPEIFTKFLASDIQKHPGTKVLGCYMMDERTAREHYDFSNEDNWPILGGDIQETLF